MLALGVLVSGQGTNLQAILDAIATRRLDAQVKMVISNRPGAPALARAERAGVPTRVIDHRAYARREDFDRALLDVLQPAGVELVVLAGFMRLLTPLFLDAYPGRVVNVHPALLPAFPGVRAQEQALAHGVKITGCTVHFVDAGVDTGPIIAQRAVPVLDDDDVERLTARILVEEHIALVDALAAIAAGRVEVVAPAGNARARTRTRPG